MVIDRYPYEYVFGRVSELAQHTDPELHQHLDRLLEDDPLCHRVRADLGSRYPLMLV